MFKIKFVMKTTYIFSFFFAFFLFSFFLSFFLSFLLSFFLSFFRGSSFSAPMFVHCYPHVLLRISTAEQFLLMKYEKAIRALLYATLTSSLVSSFVPARALGCDDGAACECVGQPLSWTPLRLVGHQMVMKTDDNVTPHVQLLVTILMLQNEFSEDMCIVTIEGHSDILSLVTYVVRSFLSNCCLYEV